MNAQEPRESTQTGFMTDDKGTPSSIRLMSLVSLLAGIFFGWLTLTHGTASQGENGVYITTLFILGAFCPKVVQKYIEDYRPKSDE